MGNNYLTADESEKLKEAKAAVERYGNIWAASRKSGIPPTTLYRRIDKVNKLSSLEPTIVEDTFKIKEIKTNENKTTVEFDGPLRLETIEQVMVKANLDPRVWRATKVTSGTWDVTMKLKNGEVLEPKTIQNYQIKVEFTRTIPFWLENSFDELLESMSKRSPQSDYWLKDITPNDKHPIMAVLSLPDAHFGMLAWHEETGADYDTKIAKRIYVDAGKRLLDNTRSVYNIDKLVLVIGNDMFHMNDNSGVTPVHKNLLDTDDRMAKVFTACVEAVKEVIDYATLFANTIRIVWVRGNHDPDTSWYLSKLLEAWYRNNTGVEVDTTYTPRKMVHYGVNLIAWTHGDEEGHRDLPAIMAGQWKKEWAASKYYEWQLGHFHKKKEMFLTTADEHSGGVRVRIIPSLTAKDAWHNKKGYMSQRAGEIYVYDSKEGPVAMFTVNVDNKENKLREA